jgi:uncharacterized membrane protein YdjX (TVP38/TMEM64 family)
LALGVLGTVFGATVTFYFARLFGCTLLGTRLAQRFYALDYLLQARPFSLTLLIRLLPIGNNLVTNLAAGISGVRARPYLAASALGFLPQNAVFTLAGTGVSLGSGSDLALAAALLLAATPLGLWLYRRHRRELGKAPDPAPQLETSVLARTPEGAP